MTYDLKALRDLEKRLAEAKGPSFNLEQLIYDIDHETRRKNLKQPIYTHSLDSAVALVERVLWGRGLLIGRGRTRPDEPLWGAQILASDENAEQRDMPVLAEAEHDTAAVALCLACVRALIAQEEVA